MSFRRWFLPLGLYSPLAHLPRADWRSLCGLWDLTRPGVIEAERGAVPCPLCVDVVEAGASHAGGEAAVEGRSPGKAASVAFPPATPALIALCLGLLLIAAPVAAAPILAWDPVTTGLDGLPLDAGLAVTEYRVYQCLTGLGSCTLATATRVAVIPAPATSLDLVGKTIPSAYVVTAVNKAGESAGSAALKVMPPDAPKGQRLQ